MSRYVFNPVTGIREESKYLCPKCNKPARTICDCKLEDCSCINNHHWYYIHNNVIIGVVEHNDPISPISPNSQLSYSDDSE